MSGSRATEGAWSPDAPIASLQDAILARPTTPERRMADAVRALAIDAIEAAGSGHPGMPLGMADAATALWTRFLRFDAADPRWPDRDRFVLSAGHGSMLLYALLHLTGHAGMGAADLARFRRLDSPAAGHPEFGAHPAIEATTGPLGQGLAIAVGMALAERMLAARFGRSLVDHRTWVIASDGDLMRGRQPRGRRPRRAPAAREADRAVGRQQRLARRRHRAVALRRPAEAVRRLGLGGQAGRRARPGAGRRRALAGAALAEADADRLPHHHRPGAPTKAGTAAATAAARRGEAQAAKRALGWNHPPFAVPDGLPSSGARPGARGAAARRAWLKRLAKHPMRAEFERVMAGQLPDALHETHRRAARRDRRQAADARRSRRRAAWRWTALVPAMPELVGGSADLPARP